ncbi:MAG: hypothetical protein ACLRYM_14900 [Thomasclavelia ramosa]
MIIKKSFWYVRIIMIVDSYNRICQTEVINKDEIIKELKEKNTEYCMKKYLFLRDKYLILSKSFIKNNNDSIQK